MVVFWTIALRPRGRRFSNRRSGEVALTHVPAPLIDAVDPTGIGDAFGAGYVGAWLNGAEPDDATGGAVRSGSVVSRTVGRASVILTSIVPNTGCG